MRGHLRPLRESVVSMALGKALRACIWSRSSNTFEIWLGETLRLSHFDHSRSHEDQERRRRRRGAGVEKKVQEEASVHYFQMGTENPVRCSNVDNSSAGPIHLFQCMEV